MVDLADVATEVIDQDLDHALANLPKFDTPSAIECLECGSDIPEQRRRLGGVTLCVGCQTELEAKRKHFGRVR